MHPRIMLCVAAIIGMLFFAGAAQAAPFDVNCGAANDVDTNPATVVNCNVGVSGTITDLNVVIELDDLSITDPYATDLQISLTHVTTATSAVIYIGPEVFAPSSRMVATFDDAAAGAPPGSGDILGVFLPAETLAIFNGLELSGDWELSILDASFYPNEGIDLMEWRLTGAQVPEPGSGVLLGCGLAGLVHLSGRKRLVA